MPGAGSTCVDCQYLCGAQPRSDCRAADAAGGRATLAVERSSPYQGAVRVAWPRAGADVQAFGDPTHATSYALCVYDAASARPILEAQARRGHAWSRPSAGIWTFKDRSATYGLSDLLLVAKPHGLAKLLAHGRSANLLPTLPLVTPVVVQLVTSDGACWQVRFDAARKSTATKFTAASRG
jgi:hypothetical protein